MSDSEYEDFGSGDESFDDELDEVYETKADIFEDEDDCENLKCKILSRQEVSAFLEEECKSLTQSLPANKISTSVAKAILLRHQWDQNEAKQAIKAKKYILCDQLNSIPNKNQEECEVCGMDDFESFLSPRCGHKYCFQCWKFHTISRLQQRLDVCCMERSCKLVLTENAIKPLISTALNKRLENVLFDCMIVSHPRLRFCPGPNCQKVIFSIQAPAAKRVQCTSCFTSCCFMCGLEFHLPTECKNIKTWLKKCSDDSETANYISVNTKDCPKCNSCIEKSGGCNHMACSQCGYDFCWMCNGPWKDHGAQYYECSKYKEDETVGDVQTDSRVSLSKYLHYFQRWENHCRSLKLEKKFMEKLDTLAKKEVAEKRGTWIDWEHLKSSGKLLARCRYTLKYTYPKAYMMPTGKEKDLFEYQQGILEAECEDLAWKLEHANEYSIAELKQSSSAAARSRLNLVKTSSTSS